MLRDVMRRLGQALRPVRPGMAFLATGRMSGWLPMGIKVTSPAFGDGEPIPARFTQDGENLFPPIAWSNLPEGTQSLVLLVEDADIPLPKPLVHLIAYGIDPALGKLDEGAVPLRLVGTSPLGFACGRNALARPGWTAPTPPPGHGPHRYAFQLFALKGRPEFPYPPGRSLLLRTIRPLLLGSGRLVGTYERH